jgi:TonB-linked SusC/RagA family outer membrane protein
MRIGLGVGTLALAAGLLLAASAPSEALAQETGTIAGTVQDSNGRSMWGVQVSIPETRLGSLSDAQGRFRIANVPAGEYTLRIEMIGYETLTRAVTVSPNETALLDVSLVQRAVALEGLVVTAMGISRQERAIGSAVQTVQPEQLQQARETNIVSALAGRAAGVQVRSTGTQGGSARVVIRGASSFTGENQPLFVVDGVPIDNSAPRLTGGAGAGTSAGAVDYGNAASDINPNDIETITILKGPNAAALYGSRAANGAIVITTKSGRSAAGLPGGLISVSQNVTFETPLRLPDYQNEYGQGRRGEFGFVDGRGGGLYDGVDESWGPPLDGRLICQFDSPRGSGGDCQPTPWLARPNNVKDFFETGRTLTTNVSFAAATDNSNVRLSITNMDMGGMYPQMELGQLTTALSGGASLMDRMRVNSSVQYIRRAGRNQPGVGYLGTNPMQQFIWFGRQVDTHALRNYRNDDGSVFNWNHNYFGNPFFMAQENSNNHDRDRIIGNVGLEYQFNDWLGARVGIGTDWYEDVRIRQYAHGNTGLGFAQQGGLYEQQASRQETNADFVLTADRQLTSEISLSANAGAARRVGWARFNDMGANQLNVPGVYNFSNASTTPTFFNRLEERQINSLYGQAQFGFRDFFYVDATGRNDWSSTLPDGNNSYFYPSVSTSLILSDIVPALQRSSALSFAKLRASWARVGNDADPYLTNLVYSAAAPWGGSPNFTVPAQLPNLDLRPEQTTSVEVGADLRFFQDRMGLDFTYYSSESLDQIVPVQVSATSGYTSRVMNAGLMSNKGFEVLGTFVPVSLPNGFRWEVAANYAKNTNEVVRLADDLETLVLGAYWSLQVQARRGEPYGALFGRQYVRDGQGRVVVGANGIPVNTNENPLGVIGNYNPDWTGSLSNTFRYRDLDLSFMLDTQQGGQVFSVTQYFGTYAGVLQETLEGRCVGAADCAVNGLLFDGVYADGTPNTTRVSAEDFWPAHFGLHEPFVLDASFVKLRELRIGYNLPMSFTDRLRVSSANLSLVGRNLWLSTPMPHIDPEVSFDASNVQGLEFGSLPSARSFGLFLSLAR